MKRDETLIFSVIDADDRFVGSVEMHGLLDDCPELGVWIVESEQGKGYAFETLNFILSITLGESQNFRYCVLLLSFIF